MPNPWLKKRIDTLMLHYGSWHRQTYLSPHFDIIQEIVTILQFFDINLHVHTGLDTVSLTDTYRLALIDCKNFTQSSTPPHTITVIPSCKASLHIGSSLITSKERTILQKVLPTQNIHKYYSQKFSWSDSTISSIDWDARIKAATKLRRWKFITQLSCEWLPTNHHLHTVEGISPRCALCSTDETVDHIFQCTHRQVYQDMFQTNLQSLLSDLKTPPDLANLICHNIRRTIAQTPHHGPHPQANIGWQMFLRGFITTAFRPLTPKYWSSRLCFFLLTQAHNLWKQRCTENNDTKINRESTHLRNRMRAKVEEVYNLSQSLPPHIQHRFLPEPMEHFLQAHPSNSILLWYSSTKPAIQACISRLHIRNDASRLSPLHPSNMRTPPD
jgi:hypothetical protein